jgi:hypothetical protein
MINDDYVNQLLIENNLKHLNLFSLASKRTLIFVLFDRSLTRIIVSLGRPQPMSRHTTTFIFLSFFQKNITIIRLYTIPQGQRKSHTFLFFHSINCFGTLFNKKTKLIKVPERKRTTKIHLIHVNGFIFDII